ncbi:glycosyltransferase family 25 protein [Glaesserella parasuis]|nr:glycosyltransferase family 25 protein [Glaesserella parasuis]
MFVGYVINLNHRTDRLYNFYQHPDAKYFERMVAIDKTTIQQLDNSVGGAFLFDDRYVKEMYQRDVTSGEIGCTLSHIKCWHRIANNSKLEDDDFAVVAEDDVFLCQAFAYNISKLQTILKNHPEINLVILQRLFYENNPIYNFAEGNIETINFVFYEQVQYFDNAGSSLYLMKKKQARSIIDRLNSNKPHWLADNFSLFCEHNNIRVLSTLLGKIINGVEAESDLESDRQKSRKESI